MPVCTYCSDLGSPSHDASWQTIARHRQLWRQRQNLPPFTDQTHGQNLPSFSNEVVDDPEPTPSELSTHSSQDLEYDEIDDGYDEIDDGKHPFPFYDVVITNVCS
jgi:hypothetical protein